MLVHVSHIGRFRQQVSKYPGRSVTRIFAFGDQPSAVGRAKPPRPFLKGLPAFGTKYLPGHRFVRHFKCFPTAMEMEITLTTKRPNRADISGDTDEVR